MLNAGGFAGCREQAVAGKPDSIPTRLNRISQRVSQRGGTDVFAVAVETL